MPTTTYFLATAGHATGTHGVENHRYAGQDTRDQHPLAKTFSIAMSELLL